MPFIVDMLIKRHYFKDRNTGNGKQMNYEWDQAKNTANKAKHGLSFDDMNRFDWTFAICTDAQYVNGEERELWVGPISLTLAAVVTVERTGGVVRIVSLRRATNTEITLWRE